MIQTNLAATLRTEKGKKSIVRKLRENGFVPAVCYGAIKEPISIYVTAKELKAALSTEAKEHVLINIKTDKKSALDSKTVILKEIVRHPLKRDFIHADFQVLDMSKPIKVSVEIKLLGKPVGVAMGGILDQIKRDIEIKCLPSEIPEHFDVDVSGLDVGDSLHISDINIPDNLQVLTSPDLTIAVVISPVAEKAAEEEAAVEEGAEEEKETAEE